MYLPGALVVALFPMVAQNEALQRSSLPLLVQGLAVTFGLALTGAIFFFLTAEWIIRVLYGDAYRGAAAVLQLYGFAMVPMALITVLEHFLLAKGRAFFAYLMMTTPPLQWLLISGIFNKSLTDAVWVIGWCAWTLLGVGCLWLLLLQLRQRR